MPARHLPSRPRSTHEVRSLDRTRLTITSSTARRQIPEPGPNQQCCTLRLGRAEEEDGVPARGIQHVDLAVGDVERSLAFYTALLGPLGLEERFRLHDIPRHRGGRLPRIWIAGFGSAAGGRWPLPVPQRRDRAPGVRGRSCGRGRRDVREMRVSRRRDPIATSSTITSRTRTITRSSRSIRTASGSKCSSGRARPTARPRKSQQQEAPPALGRVVDGCHQLEHRRREVSTCCCTRAIRSLNSGLSFQARCASKLSHAPKLM